jgi:DnaJ like chaperone protein
VEDGEIRRAYLRMMSRYHPDKLVRENLSEETLRIAQEKSTAIRSAYETVCGFRKIRA